MTHWKEFEDLPYIGFYSVADGKEIVATIKSIVKEKVVGVGGTKKMCRVCHFEENIKPMILNSSHCKVLTRITGTWDIEQWVGYKIQIYGDPKVKFAGETTGGLKIREKLVKAKEICAKCEDCGKDIQPRSGMTSQQFAEYTKANCGKAVCYECAMKISEANKEKKNGAE